MKPQPTPLPDWVVNCDPSFHAFTSYTDRSMERDQLLRSIEVTPETVKYMYSEYSPEHVTYQRGTRPLLAQIVDKVCAGCVTDREKAIALVEWRRANYTHVGKCGLGSEEEITLGGYSMCHDASRSLIILAQVAGLGSRMVIGLNDAVETGHTLTEICVDGRWTVFDPSPTLPWGWLETTDGNLLSAWDIRQQPQLLAACPRHRESKMTDEYYGSLFANYRLVNYTLEESLAFMSLRFVRYATAAHALANYDYQGHLVQQRVGAFVNFEGSVDQWLEATLQNVPAKV